MSVELSWPDTLPTPSRDRYRIRPGKGVRRTEMEGGPARQRRLYTQTPAGIPVLWRMTNSQYGLFEAWYEHKADAGATWFNTQLRGGQGMQNHIARFIDEFEATPISGGRWEVHAELEIRERPIFSEDELDILLTDDMDLLEISIAGLHTLTHTTLPIQVTL